MAVRVQLRHDTAANWTSVNPVLAVGEAGVETDTTKHKVGDGATAWTSLPYALSATALTRTAVKTANYTAAANELVPVDTTGGAVTITLPSAPPDKTQVAVKHIVQGGSNVVTIARGGADVFNKAAGSTSLTLPLVNQATVLAYDAAAAVWTVLSDDLPLGALDVRYVALAATQPGTVGTPTEVDIFKIQPVDTAKAPFGARLGGSPFLSTYDSVMYSGYNPDQVLAAEPTLQYCVEEDYESSAGVHKMEIYGEFRAAHAAAQVRPFFAQIDRNTYQTIFASQHDTFNLQDRATGFAYWSASVGAVALTSPTGTDPSYTITAPTGRTPAIILNITGAASNPVAKLSASATSMSVTQANNTVARFYGTIASAAGACMAVGVDDNAAIATFAMGVTNTTRKGLVVRGRALWGANAVEVQDENSVARIFVTKATVAVAPSLVVGNAALGTTATDGFIYAPSCAGTPTGTPTAFTGTVPIVVDTTGSKLWAYVGGAWKSAALA